MLSVLVVRKKNLELEILPGEIFSSISPTSLVSEIFYLLYCSNDYIDDMVTIATLAKINSAKVFLQHRGNWSW